LGRLVELKVNEKLTMPYETYRGHAIIASAVFDGSTTEWRPVASVGWRGPQDARRQVPILGEWPERFVSADEALAFAMASAQHWVDSRVTELSK
jgi:hypothetical protein